MELKKVKSKLGSGHYEEQKKAPNPHKFGQRIQYFQLKMVCLFSLFRHEKFVSIFFFCVIMTFPTRLSWPNIAGVLSPNLSNFV